MNKAGYIAVIILLTLGWSSCNKVGGNADKSEAVIEFDTIKYDFGEIPFDGDGMMEFVFTNTGTVPLLVTHVKSTCGCTIPEWSREPVNAGKKGTIQVSYDTHRVGVFNKSIYVYSNANNGVQRLSISGKISSASLE